MLYRRRILLALLQAIGDGLQRVDFQKHLFLFTRAQRTPAFDFIPYNFGCFSFIAESDRQVLIEQGKLLDADDWARTRDSDYAGNLKDHDRAALVAHKRRFGHLRGPSLVRYVYREYPYYAINSTIAAGLLTDEELARVQQARPKVSGAALLTLGYEGKSIEAYLNQLVEQNVDILCDVRRNPFSRKYGFSKRRLQQAVEGVGIVYRHFAGLGIPSAKRKELNTQADYDRLFDYYEQEILPNCGSDLEDIMAFLENGKRVALTCFELHSQQCHRSRVAKALTEHTQWQYQLLNI